MIRNSVIVCLLLTGIALITYPWVDRKIQENKQNMLLTEWKAARDNDSTKDRIKIDLLKTKTQPPLQSGLLSETTTGASTTEKPEYKLPAVDGEVMIGTITIPSIDVYEPILQETTPKSLKIGIGSVEPDRAPGENGNFILAGHRSRTYGKQFNRLNELAKDDEIIIESESGKYVYSVTDSFLVEPDDLSVLDQVDHDSELTLITCDPAVNPTHRLIVRAEKKSSG